MSRISSLMRLSWIAGLLLQAGLVLAALPSDEFCTQFMCIRAVIDSPSRTVVYSLGPPAASPIPQSSFGWMAIGFGSQMANTPMIIVWPNSDSSFTISQRRSSSQVQPRPDSNAGFTASLMPALSYTNSSNTVVSFSVPLSAISMDNGKQSLIWAYGSTNPQSSDAGANLLQHRASGDAQVNLLGLNATQSASSGASATSTSAISIPTFGTGTDPSSGSGSGTTSGNSNGSSATSSGIFSFHKTLIIHVVLGSLFAMLFLPLGVIIARFGRATQPGQNRKWWFPVHAAWQGVITFALGLAAIGTGHLLNTPLDSTHQTLGNVVLGVLVAQVVLGILAHWRRQILRMKKPGRSIFNYIHMLLGLALMGLAWAQVWTGFRNEWPIWSGTGPASNGWTIGWAVLVAVPSALYIAGCFLLPKQLKAEKARGSPADSNDNVALNDKAPGGRLLAHREIQ